MNSTCDCMPACQLPSFAELMARRWHLGKMQTARPRNPANVSQK